MSLQSSSGQTKKACFFLFSKRSRKRELAQAMKELQEKQNIIETLTIEKEELEEQLRGHALAETKAADVEDVQIETVGLHQLKEEIERHQEEAKANKDLMLQYKEALISALADFDILQAEDSVKRSLIADLEVQISSLKADLEDEHQRWHDAQHNYERQDVQMETLKEEIERLKEEAKANKDHMLQYKEALKSVLAKFDILKAEDSVKRS